MKSEIVFKSASGKKLVFKIERYTDTITFSTPINPCKSENINVDMLTAYVDGKEYEHCNLPGFFKTIPVAGQRKVWGLKIAFSNPSDADRYDAWVDSVMASDVGEIAEDRAREWEVEEAKAIIAKAESQRDIPSSEEASRRMSDYNRINNEGGEGYVPRIVSQEEYLSAKEVLR
jgi:hypothetical protein